MGVDYSHEHEQKDEQRHGPKLVTVEQSIQVRIRRGWDRMARQASMRKSRSESRSGQKHQSQK